MLALILAACILRIIMIAFQFPTTNSDEAVMGLMARHIAYKGEFPVFFYGQGYMDSLEAYIGAFFFHLLGGSSLFALRLGLILLYAGFMISIYFLTRFLYNKKLALFVVLLLSFGSDYIIAHQLWAFGGYPEMLICATLTFLIAGKIVFSAPPLGIQSPGKIQQQRLLLYGLLGLTTGLGIWADPLILTFLLPAYLLILIFCYREVFS